MKSFSFEDFQSLYNEYMQQADTDKKAFLDKLLLQKKISTNLYDLLKKDISIHELIAVSWEDGSDDVEEDPYGIDRILIQDILDLHEIYTDLEIQEDISSEAFWEIYRPSIHYIIFSDHANDTFLSKELSAIIEKYPYVAHTLTGPDADKLLDSKDLILELIDTLYPHTKLDRWFIISTIPKIIKRIAQKISMTHKNLINNNINIDHLAEDLLYRWDIDIAESIIPSVLIPRIRHTYTNYDSYYVPKYRDKEHIQGNDEKDYEDTDLDIAKKIIHRYCWGMLKNTTMELHPYISGVFTRYDDMWYFVYKNHIDGSVRRIYIDDIDDTMPKDIEESDYYVIYKRHLLDRIKEDIRVFWLEEIAIATEQERYEDLQILHRNLQDLDSRHYGDFA